MRAGNGGSIATLTAVKGKPKIEHRQENYPVGHEAVSSLDSPSAMFSLVAAQTQRLHIPESTASGRVVSLIAEVMHLQRIAALGPHTAASAPIAVAYERQPPGELPAPAAQVTVVLSPPGLSGYRHQTLTDRRKSMR